MEAGWPAYLSLRDGELRARAERAVALLADCRACPRDCGVDRLADLWSACKTGRHAVVSSHFPHFGEEDCLRGWAGSGTVFFSHCNLRCVFCQNQDISQGIAPGRTQDAVPPDRLAEMMLELQALGCHNLNLVTPEHVVPQIVEALPLAVERGLTLPIVYNTSGYDGLESLRLMEGLVDIYMPDFKLWTAERSKAYLKAADYPAAARAALAAMHAQVGPLQLDAEGLARRGVLIRHLVMPGCLEETHAILAWIATELGTDSYVNLMNQYHPAGDVGAGQHAEIDCGLPSEDFDRARRIAHDLGLTRLDRRRPHRRLLRRFLAP